MSRGLDNCNPGNIRLSGVRYRGEVVPSQDVAFKQFEAVEWGYRAMFVLLDTYRVRYGIDTLRTMIERYAPPSENHTAAYIDYLTQMTGISPNERLNTRDARTMIPLVAAMSRVENGVAAHLPDVERGWELTGFGGLD